MLTSQQEKAFKYIYSVADGYKRVLPLLPNITGISVVSNYNRFYKDIRTNTPEHERVWTAEWAESKIVLFEELEKLVALFPNETNAFMTTWDFKDIKNMVFSAYEIIWDEMNIQSFPSTYNIDIQMFDSYLLSPNCFNSINSIIDPNYIDDRQRYNNIVKSAKIAYIRKITLPEWNVQNETTKITPKEQWYERITGIEQL